jgi:pimeloyl-ACP methyl ester carboxylesterase
VTADTVEIGRARLLVREWGPPSGTPLLCWIPLGSTSNSLYFAELAEALVAGYALRVLSFDPPGFGGSPGQAAERYEPRRLAELTAELLAARGIARAAVLGFSWGGLIAAQFAADYPERTHALVLIDGGYIDPSERPDLDLELSLERRIEQAREELARERYPTWEAFLRAERDAVVRWSAAIEEATRLGAHEEAGEIVPLLKPEVLAAATQGIATTPIPPLLEELRSTAVPVLLLAPAEPQAEFRTKALERFRAEVPRANVRQLGSRHDLIDELGSHEVARIVGEWLAGDYADERT